MPTSPMSYLVERANEALITDLKTLLGIDPSLLAKLAVKVNTDSGIQISAADQDEVFHLWGGTGLLAERLTDALSVSKHLFESALEREVPVDDLLAELDVLCQARAITGFEPRREALKRLLTPTKRYLEKRKVLPWARGVERNLKSISGAVQMRAVFKEKNSAELLGYVPIVVLRLSTVLDRDEGEKDEESFVFQLAPKTLETFIRHIQGYKRQLMTMKDHLPDGFEVMYEFGDDADGE